MIKKISILLFTTVLFACTSIGTPKPDWVDSKPRNTEKTKFFTYGPAGSRQQAKEQLYKEISEFFGIKVSSLDKFVKVVDFSDGERTINQSTETNIDIESREKGLNSVEILEIWYDAKNDNWYIYASLDSKAEKLIKEQVAIDIENERIQGVLATGENYSVEAQNRLNIINDKMLEVKRLKISMEQSLDKINEITSNNEIMTLSREILANNYKADSLSKQIKLLENEVKVLNKKNELLISKLDGHDVEILELELFIKDSTDSLLNAQDSVLDLTNIENDLKFITDSADEAYLKAELEILGSEEEQKQRLADLKIRINENYNLIMEYKDRSKLIQSQSEDSLRKIKQTINSESENFRSLLDNIELEIKSISDNLVNLESNVEKVNVLRTSVNFDIEESLKSNFITDIEKNELTKISRNIDSPISWIESNKDKLVIIKGAADDVLDDFKVKHLLDIEIDRVVTEFSQKVEDETNLSIGTFTIGDTKIGAQFSNFLTDKFINTAANFNNLSLIDFDELTEELNRNNFSPDDLLNGDKKLSNSVDSVIYGNYWVYNNEVELKVTAKDVRNNRIYFAKSIKFPRRSIPARFELEPRNLDAIIKTSNKLTGDRLKGFKIWPDKGTGSTYIDGEDMVIHVHTPTAGYIKIYHVSADNELTLVFPNKFDKNNKMKAGAHYTVGDASYPFKFTLGRPYGTEAIKAIFSTEQFPDLVGEKFLNDFLYSGLRGIDLEERKDNDFGSGKFVTTSYYTIVK